MTYLSIGIGAFFGAIARYQIGLWLTPQREAVLGFPWGTFVINTSGSFLLGFLMRSLATSDRNELKALLTTGFCGGYTTFSTFSFELMALALERQTATAVIYLAASMIAPPLACLAGWLLAGVVSGR